MNLNRCWKLWVFIILSVSSACISAVILSSEALNSESTAWKVKENIVQNPIIAPESDIINEKLSESRIETEKLQKQNIDDSIKSDKSDQDLTTEKNLPRSETQLPQPNILNIQRHEIKVKEESSGEKNVENNGVPSIAVPAPIAIEGATKEILVDAQLTGDVENATGEIANDFVLTDKQANVPTIANNDDETQGNVSITVDVQTDVNEEDSVFNATAGKDVLNLTVDENQIPVFSEWAQKRLEEVEKQVEQEVVNTSSMKKNASAASKPPVLKLKNLKNYASPDCGAKIIAANSESSGTGYVLTSTKDEYLLSPCKSRIWFVVELCEAIQAERIDLANFELFSSSPKNFSVAVSSRFPTRDWSNIGKFIAKDERYIQSFDLYPHLFGKYVRVDIHSHYNSEHFCPISLFRVYGTSEFEAFETENRQHPIDDIDEDEDDDQESDVTKSKSNIFKSASDAVMSIVDTVKKAASFVKPNENKTIDHNAQAILSSNLLSSGNCITPNHAISCENCSDDVAREVTALVECKQHLLKRLLSIDIIRNSLYKSQICNTLIGSDLNINCNELVDVNNTTLKLTDLQMDYITHLFSLKYITAMCNLLAAGDRKVSWNSTISMNPEPPINVTIDKNSGDKLLSNEQITQKPTAPVLQTNQSMEHTSSENPIENDKKNEKTTVNTRTGSYENSHQTDVNTNDEKHTEAAVSIETTTISPTIESDERVPDGQNIFNIIEPTTETIADSLSKPGTEVETQTTESPSANAEQDAPPRVIILPETTTQTPNTDLNDANEEHSNGWTNTPQFGQKLHSESVFLRLSNRVKALERNMSLSGQYLEELSRRYKKQVEELQMSFAKTLINIEEQSRRNLERKQELFEQNEKLRNELDILTERLFSWKNILICCACFTCVQILIFHLILRIWGCKYGLQQSNRDEKRSEVTNIDEALLRKRKSGNVAMKFRRKSAEEKRERTLSESSSSALQRRPSTEALNIVGTYTDLLIDDSNSSSHIEYEINSRGDKITHFNKSTPIDSHEADISGYVKIEDLKELYDKPGEEYEFYGPMQELTSNGSCSRLDDCGSETTLDSSIDSAPSQSKKSKAIRNKQKQRRLSSPSFFKSPFSSGSAAQSTGWEWHRSKKSQQSSQINSKKSKSESPPSVKQNGINNNSTTSASMNNKSFDNQKVIRNDPARASISLSIDDRKTSGSFKRILKKIF